MPFRHVPVLIPASATVGGRLKLVQVRTVSAILMILEAMTPSSALHIINIPQKQLFLLIFCEGMGVCPTVSFGLTSVVGKAHRQPRHYPGHAAANIPTAYEGQGP